MHITTLQRRFSAWRARVLIRTTSCAACLCFAALATTTAGATNNLGAQLAYYLPSGIAYDATVPTPSAVLGYEVGEWHVRHDQLVQYMRELGRTSNRLRFEETGRTYEGRTLVLGIFSSPRNLSRLEQLRTEHVTLTDPSHAAAMLDSMPVVVVLGYSVHGNESSGSNAALVVAYHLAAAQGSEIEALLDNTIILLDPALNPDGLSRFSQWANMYRGSNPVADAEHREHVEAWPSGRTNHYWFDLNRDWLTLQHPESQARVTQFHRWKPNVVADFHEMDSDATYFFQPGVASRKHPLTPERNVELTQTIAEYHARALDARGILYYSQEDFDDFYYGKGSTYPDVNGAVGILFEQASSRGHVRESVHGELNFPFTIRNQCLTSFSTLQAAFEQRLELLRYQRDFYASAQREARDSGVRAYVFGDAKNRGASADLVRICLQHDLRVHDLARAVGAEFAPGTAYVVPVDQPQARLARALFETRTSFEDSLFYDVSAWTLPLAMGVPHAEVKTLHKEMIGAALRQPLQLRGSLPAQTATYAYAFEWHEMYAPRALGRLLRGGVRAHVALQSFKARTQSGIVSFDAGTIVVPCGIQKQPAIRLRALFETIAQDDAVDVYALETGLTPEGIDLGSPNLRPLEPPHAVLVTGGDVSTSEAGEVWHLLDHRMQVELVLVDFDQFGSLDLDEYTHVFLVDGNYDAMADDTVANLGRWLRAGGVLVATKQAAVWASEHELASVSFVEDESKKKSRNKDKDKQADPEHEESEGKVEPAIVRRPYATHERVENAQVISGAICAADVDVTHPIGFGYRDPRLAVFRNSTTFMKVSENPYGTVVRYTDTPLLSGWISAKNLRQLQGTAVVVAERVGRGTVVLMVDDPSFRGFWHGSSRLLLNALFFGSVTDRTRE